MINHVGFLRWTESELSAGIFPQHFSSAWPDLATGFTELKSIFPST